MRVLLFPAILSVIGFLLLPILSAEAASPYWAGRIAYTIPVVDDAGLLEDLELENFASAAVAYGGETNRGYGELRLEGELSYRQNALDKAHFLGEGVGLDGDARAVGFLANLYYGIDTSTVVTPYLMVGGGGAWVFLDDAEADGVEVVDDDRLQYAFQVGGGFSFALSPSVCLGLDYRYFSTSQEDFEDEAGGDLPFTYKMHEVGVGLRYRF